MTQNLIIERVPEGIRVRRIARKIAQWHARNPVESARVARAIREKAAAMRTSLDVHFTDWELAWFKRPLTR